jgi:hypothetical protein
VDPDPDPTPDLTLIFSDFKDATKKLSYFFLITYPQARYLKSLKKFYSLLKFILQALFQSGQHLNEKWEGSGGPKTCRSCGSGSTTLISFMLM